MTIPDRSEYKQNDLFTGDPSATYLNACVGYNGGPADFLDYAEGYMNAGLALVENAAEMKNPVDIMVYPIAFCFRHGLELYLKHLRVELPKAIGDKPYVNYSHLLLDNWEVVKRYVQQVEAVGATKNDVELLDRILRDFVEMDSKGEVFRYPQDKNSNPHLEDTRLINVLILGQALQQADQVLKDWCYRLV